MSLPFLGIHSAGCFISQVFEDKIRMAAKTKGKKTAAGKKK